MIKAIGDQREMADCVKSSPYFYFFEINQLDLFTIYLISKPLIKEDMKSK